MVLTSDVCLNILHASSGAGRITKIPNASVLTLAEFCFDSSIFILSELIAQTTLPFSGTVILYDSVNLMC